MHTRASEVNMPVSHPLSTLPNLAAPADARQLRQVFGCFPSGVTAVCANMGAGPIGMLVSSFTSVSLEPPLASICIMDTSRTWSALRAAPRLGISVLAHEHRGVCQRFSARQDPFDGLELTETLEGAVLLPEAGAWLDCSIYDEIAAGDHTIVLLQIEALDARPARTPLVFFGSRYHRIGA
jgi:flavin reductase (DIM6/NTAB) family NADH-FMN oxidoreductase RutF